MDKIQLNNEVVLMRKTIKRVKVQVVNRLIRNARVLRNKRGNPEQLEKNKKRCDRLVAEVQAIKEWPPDDVTYAALARTCSLVHQKDLETARERALTKLIHHKLFVKQFATFKDLVTPDLLQVKRPIKEDSIHEHKKESANHDKSQTLNKKQPENEKNKTRQAEKEHVEVEQYKPPSPSVSGESDIDDSGDSDDGESFFLPSKKMGLTSGDTGQLSDQESRDLESEEDASDVESDPAAASSSSDEDKGGNRTQGGRNEDRIRPNVDLPNVVKKERKQKNTPGISAPPKKRRVFGSESDLSASSSSDGEKMVKQRKRRKHKGPPLVDLPYVAKKETKKHIPGISAPKKRKGGQVSEGESDLSVTQQMRIQPQVDLPNRVRRETKKKYIPGISAPLSHETPSSRQQESTWKQKTFEKAKPDKTILEKHSKKKPFGNKKEQQRKRVTGKADAGLDDANLHPSWQAKKAQKDREMMAFAGKKINFDD